MTTAYILMANDGFPRDKDMLDLYTGFQEYGYDIKFYTVLDVAAGNIKVNREDILCGTINVCRIVWNQMGIKEPVVEDYPEALRPFLRRSLHKSTIRQFKKLLIENDENGFVVDYFIKPLKAKLFTGDVFGSLSSLEKIGGFSLSNSTEIYISTPINFLSEYRVYVNNGKILGMKHYYGDWELFPHVPDVKYMVSLVKDKMPVSFSVDVGVTRHVEGILQTTLVECNDGYALGNYGLDAKDYATLIRDRWWEITGYVQNTKS
jgi:hypothetical protein